MALLWSIVILLAANVATISAMLLVRRRAPEGSYFKDGDRASGVFGVLAGGFAIFAGFIIFLAWLDAYARDETELADFYCKRFRPEFKPAFVAWVATTPRKNPSAPLSPFAMAQYRLAATAAADRLEAKAVASSRRAGEFIQRADDYSLAVVLFASALFFAGISTRMRSFATRAVILGLGYALFLGSVIWIATFPVSVSV